MATRTMVAFLDMKISAFRIDTHQWPRTLQALVVDDGTPGWSGPYARISDLRDRSGADVQYTLRGAAPPRLIVRLRSGEIVTRDLQDPAAMP